MRRASSLLAFAALLIVVIVGITYTIRRSQAQHRPREIPPSLKNSEDGLALQGWKYSKDDPETNKPVVRLYANSFRVTNNPSAFELQGLALKQFNKKDANYTYIKAEKAHFDERSQVMTSEGPVSIVMNVPVDKDAENKDELAKRVQVRTAGVTYDTKTFQVKTDQRADFIFPDGSGTAVGVEYDPQTKTLHMKSQVVLDRNGMHIETSDLIYKEAEQKIYLSPWSKLQRQTMNVEAQSSVVTLSDDKDRRGKVQQIDSDRPNGSDNRKGRQVQYSADHMTAHFDDDGNMTEVLGSHNARVVSIQERAKTVITGDKADLHFELQTKAGKDKPDSYLQSVIAEGNAVAESSPVEQPGVIPTETRILRSETINLEMKPGGQEVQEIRTPSKAQLEFKPNRPDQVHRVLESSKMRIIYGDHSYVDTFMGWNVTTRTDKPPTPGQKKPPAPSYTWSDEMIAKFLPNSSSIDHIEQRGNFRYKEADRKASADKAVLEQKINRITLIDRAKVSDDTGSTQGDLIVMDQVTGDMDVTGKVLSVRAPDKSQKPGTSMLDQTQPLQAHADKMRSRDNNSDMFYDGNAVMWQGANRISADKIEINRDDQTLLASGHVVSELVDNKKTPAPTQTDGKSAPPAAPANPVYTTVKAPHLVYHDDSRVALYSGGVTLLRNAMVVNSDELRAFLTPKTDDNSSDSSLDHAFADGALTVVDTLGPNHKRTGSADHGEYYTKADKVILNGGSPQILDSLRGVTKGKDITYFSGDDRLVVEGDAKKPAFSKMIKK
jgi:lipopolysaccharide export system protein LptA